MNCLLIQTVEESGAMNFHLLSCWVSQDVGFSEKARPHWPTQRRHKLVHVCINQWSVIVLSSWGICRYLPVSRLLCQNLCTVTHKPNNNSNPLHKTMGLWETWVQNERIFCLGPEIASPTLRRHFSTSLLYVVITMEFFLFCSQWGFIVFIMRLTDQQRLNPSGAAQLNSSDLWKVISSFFSRMLKWSQSSQHHSCSNNCSKGYKRSCQHF